MAGEANVNAVVTVRLASVDDADAIGRIQVETWRAAYTGLMPDEAIAELRRRGETAAVARVVRRSPGPAAPSSSRSDDGEVVGFANVGPCREEASAGELYAIYVQPSPGAPGPAGR